MVGRYVIDERVGRGGFGDVWAARQRGHAGFERRVALKVVRPDVSGEGLSALLAEGRLLALLHHPNIVAVLDVDESDGAVCIAMELLEGESLAALMRGLGPLPAAVVIEVMERAARALDYAHHLTGPGGPLQIVHRDVSPQNLFVTTNGAVKLLDFGIARSAQTPSMTSSGLVRGKPGYMSPEQASGDPIDARSDLYALGVVAWEALTGERLFRGENELKTLLLAQRAVVPPLPQTVPPPLRAIVQGLLARDPRDRFARGDDVADALVDAADALGLPRGPAILADLLRDFEEIPDDERKTEVVAAPQSRASAAAPRAPARGRAARVAAVLVAVVVVVGVVVAGASALRAPVETPEPVPLAPAGAPPSVTRTLLPPRTQTPSPSSSPPSSAPPSSSSTPPPSSAATGSPRPKPALAPPTSTATSTSTSTRPPTAPPTSTLAAPVGEGFLRVPVEDPFVQVEVDGAVVGASPLWRHALPAGPHVVVLRDPERGAVVRRQEIDVSPGSVVVVSPGQ